MATLLSVPSEIFVQISANCSRQTLLSLATACRALSWPSLEMLWNQLDSISPLLYTLPSDAITKGRMIFRARRLIRVVNVTRELASADFERFKIYAPFVKAIIMFIPLGCDVAPDGWHLFENGCPGPLPNLRRMTTNIVFETGESAAISFGFLLGPALQQLVIRAQTLSTLDPIMALQPSVSELFASLPLRCPQLSMLGLKFNPPVPYMADALVDLLSQLHHLTTLDIDTIPLPARVFVRLRSLSILTGLKMAARASDYPERALVEGRSEALHFPSLSTLAISTDSAECLVALLERARPPSLRSLTVSICGETTAESTLKLMTAIGSHPSRITLENLAITITQVDAIDPFAFLSLPPSVLQPLHALSSLREFQLRGACQALLDDDAFVQLARAWPQLEDLWLCEMRVSPGTITLAGLVEFASLCQSVKSIRLQLADIDHSHCTSLLARLRSAKNDTTAILQHPLSLEIGRPSIGEEDIETVSEILIRAFPSLKDLSALWSYVQDSNRGPRTTGEIMQHRWNAVCRNVLTSEDSSGTRAWGVVRMIRF
ncbi:hypothetical protein FKP32DRAFT_365008 [Trametes sanguinea]|nr:hypothetical protein FKP32DRAFT_365008 [Trametes sanguinea]